MNLLTSKWSPTSSVGSIDFEGILNACTMKVVPKSASTSVTSNDWAYSRNPDFAPAPLPFPVPVPVQ
jgi:hypothetical protein